MNINRSWESACIVGYGTHAELKLLPSLKNVGINVDGIISVSYEYLVAYHDHKNFKSFIPQPISLKTIPNKKIKIDQEINIFQKNISFISSQHNI